MFEKFSGKRPHDQHPPPPSALKIGPVGLLERIQHKGSPMIPILFVFCTVVARNGPQWDRIN